MVDFTWITGGKKIKLNSEKENIVDATSFKTAKIVLKLLASEMHKNLALIRTSV